MQAEKPYTIQPATWRDLFALSELEKICFKEDAWPLLELMGVLTFPGVVRLRAVVEKEMVGFIAGDARRAEKTGWILTLGVLPFWRRRGIAYDLLSTCEQQMGMPVVKLTVRRNNESALRLYEKMGYRQVDIWSRYYRSGEDGLVLEKTIAPAFESTK
ncbi:MAG: GNAT family N-acetyltransferase [Anaerolineae bacterium]|nr:GNAT family N-acetyltransferase [Anaerolineae bacterium]